MTEKQFNNAYEAGFDAGRNGADTNNSHYSWFANIDLMNSWSRGNKDGILEKLKAEKYSGNHYRQKTVNKQ